jgi:hypothetical protein
VQVIEFVLMVGHIWIRTLHNMTGLPTGKSFESLGDGENEAGVCGEGIKLTSRD